MYKLMVNGKRLKTGTTKELIECVWNYWNIAHELGTEPQEIEGSHVGNVDIIYIKRKDGSILAELIKLNQCPLCGYLGLDEKICINCGQKSC